MLFEDYRPNVQYRLAIFLNNFFWQCCFLVMKKFSFTQLLHDKFICSPLCYFYSFVNFSPSQQYTRASFLVDKRVWKSFQHKREIVNFFVVHTSTRSCLTVTKSGFSGLKKLSESENKVVRLRVRLRTIHRWWRTSSVSKAKKRNVLSTDVLC